MPNFDDDNQNNESNDLAALTHSKKTSDATRIVFSIAGYIFLLLSAGLFGYSIYATAIWIEKDTAFFYRGGDEEQLQWLLRVYGDTIFKVIAAIFAYAFGKSLLKSAGTTTAPVIPDRDRQLLEPLVTKPKADAIDQYIRLASLGGFTGTFQKLGFSGLPLATIALTVVFAFLALFETGTEHFIDLTKLTLGAFIGSFVQREATPAGSLQRTERSSERSL